ncbi:MAG: SDR family oxidoreductase [Gammaproteobacteria bacterium]|nr:SDR family oxidoreductase [Gammaproteobacteria bacterium]
MKLSSRLEDKVAIVTGIGSGIGQGCALMFARHGARVMGADISPPGAAETLAMARAEGLAFESLQPLDLTRPDDVRRLVTHTVQRYGGVDIVVNAAAWCAFEYIEQLDYERDWKRTLTGELDIVFLACQTAWPHLKARGGGSIINFASANSYMAHPVAGALAHCAGKGGVLAMTRQLACEGGPHRIRANSISPGMIVTGATRPELAKPGYEAAILQRKMIKRLGTPEDIAWCATFLASDEASWITGADFHVDGGATAW